MADTLAQSTYKREEKLNNHRLVGELFDEIINNNECYSLAQLDINGSDLFHNGISNGKEIGEKLNFLLNLVIEGKAENKKAELLKYLK